MLRKLSREDYRLIKQFLSKIDDNFSENRDISSSPWKFIDEPHFDFFAIISKSEIVAVMVKSVHESSEHLNFLYVLPELRSLGIGQQLFNHFIETRSKELLTIHVRKELNRTIKFYRQFGFAISSTKNVESNAISEWVKKCLDYNPKTYVVNVLMSQKFD